MRSPLAVPSGRTPIAALIAGLAMTLSSPAWSQSLKEFVEAARLAPTNSRYVYVQAIAVHSAGKRDEALAILRSANKRFPADIDILDVAVLKRTTRSRQPIRYPHDASCSAAACIGNQCIPYFCPVRSYCFLLIQVAKTRICKKGHIRFFSKNAAVLDIMIL